MPDISLSGNLSNFTLDNEFEGVARHTSGVLFVNLGNTGTIDKDLIVPLIQIRGGTLKIGDDDNGYLVKTITSSWWGVREGSLYTEGNARIEIKNSILKSCGNGPFIGAYQATENQDNVTMHIENSEFYNYVDNTFVSLGQGEPMIAPGSVLKNVRVKGCAKFWLNGNLSSDSEGLTVESTGAFGMGIAVAAAGDVTIRKCHSDYLGLQQVPCGLTAYNTVVTHGLRVDQDPAETRKFSIGKTFKPAVIGIPTAYNCLILDGSGNHLYNNTVTPGSEPDIDVIWVEQERGANQGRDTIPSADIAVPRTGWTLTNRLPLSTRIRCAGYEEFNETISSFDIADQEYLKDKAIGGVALEDKGYDKDMGIISSGIAIEGTTIRVTENRNLQHIYNYIRHWLAETTNMAVDNFLSFNGSAIDIGNYSLIADGAEISSSDTVTEIRTTAAVTEENGGQVTANIVDSIGDSTGTFILPTGFTEVSLHWNSSDADNNINPVHSGSPFRYNSSTIGGTSLWVRASGTAGEIVTSIAIPVDSGGHTFEVLVTSTEQSLARIENGQAEIKTAIEQQNRGHVII